MDDYRQYIADHKPEQKICGLTKAERLEFVSRQVKARKLIRFGHVRKLADGYFARKVLGTLYHSNDKKYSL